MSQELMARPDQVTGERLADRTHSQPAGRLPPGRRKLLLSVHVVTAVSVIGAELAAIALGAAGLVSGSPELIRASYLAMGLLMEAILLPLAFGALLTGVLLALGSGWGLTKHYWVLTKLVLTITAITALVLVLRPAVHRAAAEVLQVPLADLAANGLSQGGLALLLGPAAALLVLLTNAILGVYKPRGQTRFHRR